MKKLISCAAAGILLLAVGLQNAVGAGVVRSAPSFAGAIHPPMIGAGAPVFHRGVGPMIGITAPVYRGWFRHRRFPGLGVFTYGVVPYFYDGYYADYYDDGDCYVWVRRHGVLRRVYVCE